MKKTAETGKKDVGDSVKKIKKDLAKTEKAEDVKKHAKKTTKTDTKDIEKPAK